MRYLLVCWLLLGSLAFAKDHEWKAAKVLAQYTLDGGNEAAVIPVGTALYGVSVPKQNSFYTIQIDNITYSIHNFSDGKMVNRWLLLTVGGETQGYVDGRALHIKDTEGKERKCKIVAQRIAN